MPPIAVTKMHGTFNDFIVVDARTQPLDDPASFTRAVCERRGGIGADGVLLVLPSRTADARMRVINADGSEAEMCGNGVRCVARYLSERGEGDSLRIETLAGIIACDVLQKGDAYVVRVDVGVPSVESPSDSPDDGIAVSLGNPHVVLFRADAQSFDLAAAARKMPDTNVHVAQVIDRHLLVVRHFERGAGFTLACGTGAVASAAAAIRRGFCDSPVDVRVPGGTLRVDWDGAGDAFLTGEAVRVFDTEVDTLHATPA